MVSSGVVFSSAVVDLSLDIFSVGVLMVAGTRVVSSVVGISVFSDGVTVLEILGVVGGDVISTDVVSSSVVVPSNVVDLILDSCKVVVLTVVVNFVSSSVLGETVVV